MTSITSRHLEAAIIDQSVAGSFPDDPYAFIAVIGDGGWQLGVAVANQRGYNPIPGKTFKDQDEAKEWAEGLNKHIGVSADVAAHIIISTMGGRHFDPRR